MQNVTKQFKYVSWVSVSISSLEGTRKRRIEVWQGVVVGGVRKRPMKK
jgi:hypothetical protein